MSRQTVQTARKHEEAVFEDKAAKFRGTARISLEVLHFSPQDLKDLDRKNVERLKNVFEEEGFLREEPAEHHIPAIINPELLNEAIQFTGDSRITLDTLLDNHDISSPLLRFPPGSTIECLHGKHRIQAAKESIVILHERWWTVDLYLTDLSAESKRPISEEYSNSTNFSDGVIYRKIHTYHATANYFAECQWRARLTKPKKEILTQFLKHSLSTHFNKLLRFRALWSAFKIGTLHKMIAMKIDEPAVNYVTLILNTWNAIMEGNEDLVDTIDEETLQALQLRAPALSEHDSLYISSLMDDGKIFPEVRDKSRRDTILENLCAITYPIPTIYTLRQDLKYISGPASIMRKLFIPPHKRSKRSISMAVRDSFSGVHLQEGQCLVQVTESTFKTRPGNSDDQIELGCRTLYLYAMRYVLDMVPERPRNESRKQPPKARKPNPRLWRDIANLAYRLGFESPEIHRLRSSNADEAIARDALLAARDIRRYRYPVAIDVLAKQICDIFETSVEILPDVVEPSLVLHGPGEDITRRCGRIFEDVYNDTQQYLFLEILEKPTQAKGQGITSFCVRKHVYNAFFPSYDPSHCPFETMSGGADAESSPGPVGSPSHESKSRDGSIGEEPDGSLVDQPRTESNQAATEVDSSSIHGMSQPQVENHFVSISLWKNGRWTELRSGCNRESLEDILKTGTWLDEGYHPYDMDGRGLCAEEAFDAVINQPWQTVWLAVPANKPSVFPITT